METDIFLCYRRPGAQTAKLLKRHLEAVQFPGSVWYSDGEAYGHYKDDIPQIVGSAKCAILFIDEHFSKNFLEENPENECITALELIALEKRIQADPEFRLLIVLLDCLSFPRQVQLDLEALFKKAGIYTEQSVAHFSQRNSVAFNTAAQDEYLLFEQLTSELLKTGFISSTEETGNFFFGKRSTMADVIVWDVDNGIACEDIAFQLTLEDMPLYQKIEAIRCAPTEVKQNNQLVSVAQLETTLTDDREQKCVTIHYRPIEYRFFQKTMKIWKNAGLDLTQRVKTYNTDKGLYEVPNAMGLAFMVVTADGKLIFTRRSGERELRPNEYDCSIVEGLKPEVSSALHGTYSIYDSSYVRKEIIRAFREEICPCDEDLNIKVNGIVLDKEYGQWNIVGTIFTPDTADTLIRKHSVREDTYERIYMEAVPYLDENGSMTLRYLKAVYPRFLEHKFWGMALAALYGTLRNLGFKDSQIDDVSVL